MKFIIVENSGQSPSALIDATIASIDDPAFVIAENHCIAELPPSLSCTIGVRFVPTSGGAAPGATLSVSSVAGGTVTVPLTGSATAPALE